MRPRRRSSRAPAAAWSSFGGVRYGVGAPSARLDPIPWGGAKAAGKLATSWVLALSAVFGPAGRTEVRRVGRVEGVELVSACCGAPQVLRGFMVWFGCPPGFQVVQAAGGPVVSGSVAPDGKPRRASSTAVRPRIAAATSSPTDQGLEVEPPLGVVNGKGARRCGNAGSAVVGGHALEGPASVGRVGGCAGMRSPVPKTRRTPGSVAGCNKPATHWEAQAGKAVRNREVGTCLVVGTTKPKWGQPRRRTRPMAVRRRGDL